MFYETERTRKIDVQNRYVFTGYGPMALWLSKAQRRFARKQGWLAELGGGRFGPVAGRWSLAGWLMVRPDGTACELACGLHEIRRAFYSK